MPTYVYKFVDTGETIEIQQAFTDATLTELAHPDSGDVMAVKKVFTPVGVTFKGSGFFKTDNRGGKARSESGSTEAKSGKDSTSDSKSTGASATAGSGSSSSESSSSESSSGSRDGSSAPSKTADGSAGAKKDSTVAAPKPSGSKSPSS